MQDFRKKARIPFGYRIIDGAAQVDPVESAQLKKYFSLYLSGLSMVEAAAEAGLECSKSTYRNILNRKEYTGTEPAFKLGDDIKPEDIVKALGDLLNRVRAGEVTQEQANRESLVLSNLLKAYEQVELKAKLDELEAIVGGMR